MRFVVVVMRHGRKVRLWPGGDKGRGDQSAPGFPAEGAARSA